MGTSGLLPYGIVGNGRVAAHLRHYLELEGVSIRQWSRREPGSPFESLSGCTTWLLAIKDDALESWAREHGRPGIQLVHFSGALSIPSVVGLHPLFTFGPTLYSQETYQKIPFVCESSAEQFGRIFPMLKNPAYGIDPGHKALYHGLCVIGGNLSSILWAKFLDDLEGRLGIPREAGLPYMRQVFENLAASGARSLTGPIQRRDLETLRKDRRALEGDRYAPIFDSFVKTFVGDLES
jgi:2-dehydropantoate 2-reductase